MNDDPYSYYYDYNLITADEGCIPPKQPKVKNFHNIRRYFIGDKRYTLRYHVDPCKDYERLIPSLGDKMYIIDTSDNKIELTKQMYIKLNHLVSINLLKKLKVKLYIIQGFEKIIINIYKLKINFPPSENK